MIPHMIAAWGEHRSPDIRELRFVTGVVEEAGELLKAYHRYAGLARKNGNFADVAEKLTDVIIMAMVTARVLGIDVEHAISEKLEVVFTRGWKEATP